MGMDPLQSVIRRFRFSEPATNVLILQGLNNPGPDNALATIFHAAESGDVIKMDLIFAQLVNSCKGVALIGVPG
jgi:hypothetical protein